MTTTDRLLESVTTELRQHADPAYRALVRDRYSMNVENFWGVRTPAIRKIADKHYQCLKPLPIDQRLTWCHQLLETGIYEHKITVFRWGHLCREDFSGKHLKALTKWLDQYVDDWIDCDDLCIHVLGEFFVRHPNRAKETIKWTRSKNRWMRRGAAVAIILPVRKGAQLELALDIADRLLEDTDDLVQKGYGWLLKEASKAHQAEVFHYVINQKNAMPRTAFRYALEKMPEKLKRQARSKDSFQPPNTGMQATGLPPRPSRLSRSSSDLIREGSGNTHPTPDAEAVRPS